MEYQNLTCFSRLGKFVIHLDVINIKSARHWYSSFISQQALTAVIALAAKAFLILLF